MAVERPRSTRRRGPPRAGAGERQTGVALEACYRLLLWLVPTLEKFPRSQKFLLGDRLQSQALAVLDHLIAATYLPAQRAQHLRAANLALEQMRFGFRLAHDLHHLDMPRYQHAARMTDEVGRLVDGWLRSGARQGTTIPGSVAATADCNAESLDPLHDAPDEPPHAPPRGQS